MRSILKYLLACLLCMPFFKARAQQGQFLQFWGGAQLTTLNNSSDFNAFIQNNYVDRVTTWRGVGGIDYINNFNQMVGFQSGLYYSMQGQKYSGAITYDYNTKSSDSINFQSHVYINYFRVPLMVRFNSLMDPDDRVNMSLYMGLSVGILHKVQDVYTSPGPPDSLVQVYSDFDFNKLYKTIDMGLGAGLQFNFRITKGFYLNAGARFDRSLSNIENLSYKFPKTIPVEYIFPVSVKKENRPDLLVRNPTKNTSIGFYIGFSIRLGKPGEENERISPNSLPMKADE